MNCKHIMGALAFLLSLCFIVSAIAINSDDADNNSQDFTLKAPEGNETNFDYYTNGGTLEVGPGSGMVHLVSEGHYTQYRSMTGYTPPIPIRDGYGFVGWYLDENLTDPVQVINLYGNSSYSLYAKWVERNHPAPTADNYSSLDKFEIYSTDELLTFASAVTAGNTYENKTVYLAKDIDMSRVYTLNPIGDSSNIFNGTFDGQGHVISSLVISSSDYVGFFYKIGEKGIVRNFGLDSTCSLICSNDTAVAYAGGIAFANRGTIEYCFNGASIQSSTSGRNTTCTASGIVDSNSGTITNCYNFGYVSVNSDSILDAYERTAGISDSNSGTITNCYNIGNLGSSYSGYIAIADNLNGGTTVNCYWLTTGSSTSEAKTEAEFKSPSMISLLGDAYRQDITGINNGYPILSWQASSYIVTFDSNGGSDVAAQAVKEGENAIRPADPTKQGYVFGGWYVDAALTNEYTFTTAVSSNITLYAKWYENLVFTSVPSISDIKITIDGRTISASVAADNYLYILWDLGNGEIIRTYSNELTYTYAEGGDYTITATAVNSEGYADTEFKVSINDHKNSINWISIILAAVIGIAEFAMLYKINPVIAVIAGLVAAVIVYLLVNYFF